MGFPDGFFLGQPGKFFRFLVIPDEFMWQIPQVSFPDDFYLYRFISLSGERDNFR